MPRFRPAQALPLSFLALAAALSLGAADAVPSLAVHATTVAPKIDGVISPGEWDGAAHGDAFTQVEPVENGPVRERTEFWITYDRDYVYVAVRAHDSAGRAGVRAYSMQRDQDNGSDDLIRIVFDTFHRQSDGYYFALTAAGGRHDGLIENKENANDQWDALWLGRTSIDAGGWSAEFAIPAKTLSFDPGNDTWGFNIGRAVRRTQEVMRWSGINRNKGTIALPLIGQVTGITGLAQGRGIDLKPSASVITRHHPAPDEKETELRPALDVVWHVTPSLAATLTVNTDFADAEVDERQVNIGRFPLFFPEKRSFFTQDASLFTFGGIKEDPLPFFSRRIGLADDGTKVDILGGAKLTGRAGPWTLGLLDVQLDEHAGVDAQNVFVGRVARQVFAESSAGLIFTHGDPRGGGDNSLVGADFTYANNALPGNRTISASAALQATDSDLAGGTGTAATFKVNFINDPYTFTAWFSRVSERYDPALGFVSRTGVANVHLMNYYNFRSATKYLRLIQPYVETDQVTDLDYRRLDHVVWVGTYFENRYGDNLNVWVNDAGETYDTPFAIRPGIVIPTGRHNWNAFQAELNTSTSRPMDVSLRWRHGGYLTGDGDDYQTIIAVRPNTRLQLSLSGLLRDFRLPQGDFQVRVGSARISYTFTPDLQLSLLGQYDNISESLGVNFRLKWTPVPGNDFYLVFNQGYDTSLERFRPVASDLSLKGTWTYRF
jgi:hypothetical protein